MPSHRTQMIVLIGGDLVTLALVTALGFATHGTLDTAGFRMLTTFVPVLIAWAVVAPFLGAYDMSRVTEARQLWRPFWAMVLAAPLAAWLRGVWLNAPILPVFVFVLGGVSALGILAWRAAYALFVARRLAALKVADG